MYALLPVVNCSGGQAPSSIGSGVPEAVIYLSIYLSVSRTRDRQTLGIAIMLHAVRAADAREHGARGGQVQGR